MLVYGCLGDVNSTVHQQLQVPLYTVRAGGWKCSVKVLRVHCNSSVVVEKVQLFTASVDCDAAATATVQARHALFAGRGRD
jgi:hypothetical protein